MTSLPGRSTASAMLFAAASTRLFWAMAIDQPQLQVCAWIAPLLGFIIYLPIALLCRRFCSIGSCSGWSKLSDSCPGGLSRIIALLFCLALVIDCGMSMRILASSAGQIALVDTPEILLLLPLAALAAICILLGGDAVGSNARLWVLSLPALMGITTFVHLKNNNIAWLTPILGSGIDSILRSALHCSACLTLLTPSWLLSLPDRCKRSPLLSVGAAVILASLLLTMQQMLFPSFIGTIQTREERLSLLLSNGRSALSMQMLLLILWYGGMMHLIAAEAVSAAILLKTFAPALPKGLNAVLPASTALAIASTELSSRSVSGHYAFFLFPFLAFLLLLLMALQRKRARKCT